MANPHLGEIEITDGDRTLIFCFSSNAICALEERLGLGIVDIADELSSWMPPRDAKGALMTETADEIKSRRSRLRLGFCRSLFWGGLQDHQPGMTVEQAGRLMTRIGGMVAALALIARGMQLAMPDAASGAPDTASPPKRASRSRGTGPRS